MPPKKEAKEKQLKGDEAEELVLEYLKGMNRPFASTDVSANLKNKVNKANAQKIMQTLADKGQLSVKPYGKQTIFVYNQALLNVASSEDLAGLDERLKSIKSALAEKQKEHKQITAELANTLALPPTKELGYAIKKLKSENEATLAALLPFRGESGTDAAVQPMSEDEMRKVDQDFAKWRKQWTDRRVVYKSLLDTLADGGMVADVRSMEEDSGIERDDENALAMEKGEFCKPPAIARKPLLKKSTNHAAAGAKRPASQLSDQQTSPKKKSKKV